MVALIERRPALAGRRLVKGVTKPRSKTMS
jgi:hypothetical protein